METKDILRIGILFLFCFSLFLCLSHNPVTVNATEFTEDGYPIFLITYGGTLPCYTPDELIEKSDYVVVGKIIQKDTTKWSCTVDGSQPAGVHVDVLLNEHGDKVFYYSEDGIHFPEDTIYTDMIFLVEQSYKGSFSSQEIIIRSFSGTVGAFRMETGDLNVEDYNIGERMMLFLRIDDGSTKDVGPEHYIVFPCGTYYPEDEDGDVFLSPDDEKVQFVENENGVFINSFRGQYVPHGSGGHDDHSGHADSGIWGSFQEFMKKIYNSIKR